MHKVNHVTILGYSSAEDGSKLYKEVFEVANHLASEGFVIVNGGGTGVMRAASEGAKAAGGRTIGVTFDPKEAINFEGRDPDNPLDEEIKTPNYVERTLKLLEIGEVYVIFNGGTGTISEFGMAWGLSRIYFGHNKPILLYGAFWKDIIEVFDRHMKLRPEEKRVYEIVQSPTEVIESIARFEKRMTAQGHLHPNLEDEEKPFVV